jgi:uncharacterized protein YqjF (DUF2071 family)
MNRTFLTAEWRYLAMLNFTVDPAILKPFVPAGTELDAFRGVTYASVVGFRFLATRVFGIAFPFHRNFDEVNLRFYVRRKAGADWRRGVVFIRELVPRFAIAAIARVVYGEPYSALPMRHKVDVTPANIRAEYAWRRRGQWESLSVSGKGEPQEIRPGSEEEFITEHYWGYTDRRGDCTEYQVEHPRWRVWRGIESRLDADIASLYGEPFVESLAHPPVSSFIAQGSPVTVRYHAAIGQPS